MIERHRGNTLMLPTEPLQVIGQKLAVDVLHPIPISMVISPEALLDIDSLNKAFIRNIYSADIQTRVFEPPFTVRENVLTSTLVNIINNQELSSKIASIVLCCTTPIIIESIYNDAEKYSSKSEKLDTENEIIEIAEYLHGLETLEEQCAYVYQDSFNSGGHFFPDYVGSYFNVNSKESFIQAAREPVEFFLQALIANKYKKNNEEYNLNQEEMDKIWEFFLKPLLSILTTDTDNDDPNLQRGLPTEPQVPALAA